MDQIKAPIGAAVTQDKVEEALKAKKYKLLTFTHVDTSTGEWHPLFFFLLAHGLVSAVLSDAKAIAETVKRVSPETLVCSSYVPEAIFMMLTLLGDSGWSVLCCK